jgi:tungstate transport system ATP-binding protein
MTRSSPVFSCQAVDLRFGAVHALRAVNLQIGRGERVALVGANGSGKSSLLRLFHGLVKPTAGLLNRDTSIRQAMLFQRPHMLRASVANNVAIGLWIQGLSWREANERALLALARVGLADQAKRAARAMSGGQMQRLALARAWSMKPDVLLLDEPTASLDPHAKREVERLMEDLAADGIGLVFASHNLGQVKRLADRVLYLERGRVLVDLPVADFFDADRLEEVSTEASLFVKGERI